MVLIDFFADGVFFARLPFRSARTLPKGHSTIDKRVYESARISSTISRSLPNHHLIELLAKGMRVEKRQNGMTGAQAKMAIIAKYLWNYDWFNKSKSGHNSAVGTTDSRWLGNQRRMALLFVLYALSDCIAVLAREVASRIIIALARESRGCRRLLRPIVAA